MAGNDVTLNIGANTAAAERQIQQMIARSQAVAGKQSFKMTLDGKGFNQPLGRITGNLNQFQGAMDASIARTLAFGASVAVIGGVAKAFKDLVSVTASVEKSLKDINVLLQLSSKDLAGLSKSLFDVAKNTAQSFDTVSVAATEFSRQGLGAAETARRVNDALILTRLSGLDAAASVSALTAAVNGFKREAVTTTEVVNRLANVDAAFAVSSGDLAAALSRAGSVAQDAKVKFNELVAATTAVQQATARGGNVIGNGFKTIFTRLQRSKVREELEAIGVATTNSTGNIRGAIDILKDYAKVYQTLSDTQKAYTSEQVAGVFQINTLKALVNDLANDFGVYNQALAVANQTTDEAVTRNAELNKTLSALTSQTGTELEQLAAGIGGLAFEDNFKGILGIIKSALGSLNTLVDSDSLGGDLARGVIRGFGSFISGPGLALALIGITKLLTFIGKETAVALKQVMAIGSQSQKRQVVQERIIALLREDTSLMSQIFSSSGKVADINKIVAASIRAQNVALMEQKALVTSIATAFAINKAGMVVPRGGGGRGRGAAGGFIPNLVQQEKTNISRGVGGARSGDRPVILPNFNMGGGKRGMMVAHTGEHIVPNFARGGSAIFNRSMAASMGLPAGAQRLGAGGYVPNFAVSTARTGAGASRGAGSRAGPASVLAPYGSKAELDAAIKANPNIATISKNPRDGSNTYSFPRPGGGTPIKVTSAYYTNKFAGKKAERAFNVYQADQKGGAFMAIPGAEGMRVPIKADFDNAPLQIGKQKVKRFRGLAFGVNPQGVADKQDQATIKKLSGIDRKLDDSMLKAANYLLTEVGTIPPLPKSIGSSTQLQKFLGEGGWGGVQAAKGGFFEGIVSAIVGGARAGDANTRLDIVMAKGGRQKELLESIFDLPPGRFKAGDFKASPSTNNVRKFALQVAAGANANLLPQKLNQPGVLGSGGFVPSFANLSTLQGVSQTPAGQRALKTERALAGSAKMGFDSRVGFGVYNNSQGSLGRAISQHLSSGDSPSSLSSMGSAAQAAAVSAVLGYIPNFVRPGPYDPRGLQFRGGGPYGAPGAAGPGAGMGLSKQQIRQAHQALRMMNKAMLEMNTSTTLTSDELKKLKKVMGSEHAKLIAMGVSVDNFSKATQAATTATKALAQRNMNAATMAATSMGGRMDVTRGGKEGAYAKAYKEDKKRSMTRGQRIGASMKKGLGAGGGMGAYFAGSMLIGQIREQAAQGETYEGQKGLGGVADVGQGIMMGGMFGGKWGALAGALVGATTAIWKFTDGAAKASFEFKKIASELEGTKTAANNYAAALAALQKEQDPGKRGELHARAAAAQDSLSPEMQARLEAAAGGKEGALGKQLIEEQKALAIEVNEAKIKESITKWNALKIDYVREFFKDPSKAYRASMGIGETETQEEGRKGLISAGRQLAARTAIATDEKGQVQPKEQLANLQRQMAFLAAGNEGAIQILQSWGVDIENAGVETEAQAKELFTGFAESFGLMLRGASEAVLKSIQEGIAQARAAIEDVDYGPAMDVRRAAGRETGYGAATVKQHEGFRKQRVDLIRGAIKGMVPEIMSDEAKDRVLRGAEKDMIIQGGASASRSNKVALDQALLKQYDEAQKIDPTDKGQLGSAYEGQKISGTKERDVSIEAIHAIQSAVEKGTLIDKDTGRIQEGFLQAVVEELGDSSPIVGVLKSMDAKEALIASGVEGNLALASERNELIDHQREDIVQQLIKNAQGKEIDFEGISDAIKVLGESSIATEGGIEKVGERAAAAEFLAKKYTDMGQLDEAKKFAKRGEAEREVENALKVRGIVTTEAPEPPRNRQSGPPQGEFQTMTGPDAASKERRQQAHRYRRELEAGGLEQFEKDERVSAIKVLQAQEKGSKYFSLSPDTKQARDDNEAAMENYLGDAIKPGPEELTGIERMTKGASAAAVALVMFTEAVKDAGEARDLAKQKREVETELQPKEKALATKEQALADSRVKNEIEDREATLTMKEDEGFSAYQEKLEGQAKWGSGGGVVADVARLWAPAAADWIGGGAPGEGGTTNWRGADIPEKVQREMFELTPEAHDLKGQREELEKAKAADWKAAAEIKKLSGEVDDLQGVLDSLGTAAGSVLEAQETLAAAEKGEAAAKEVVAAEKGGELIPTEKLDKLTEAIDAGTEASKELRDETKKAREEEAKAKAEPPAPTPAPPPPPPPPPPPAPPETASVDITVHATGKDEIIIADAVEVAVRNAMQGLANDGAQVGGVMMLG